MGPQDGKALQTLAGHTNWVRSIAFLSTAGSLLQVRGIEPHGCGIERPFCKKDLTQEYKHIFLFNLYFMEGSGEVVLIVVLVVTLVLESSKMVMC